MCRSELLQDAIKSIYQLGDSLKALANSMTLSDDFEQISPPEETPPTDSPAENPVALSDVRAVLADKSRNGFTNEVKALLKKHGADKLSGIAKSEYAALMKEAEELGS